VLGKITCDPHKVESAEYCIGERVDDLLLMLKRYSRVYCNLGTGQKYTLRPHTVSSVTSVANVPLYSSFSFDWYTMVCCMFGYQRGGVRIRFQGKTIIASATNPQLIRNDWTGMILFPSSVFTPSSLPISVFAPAATPKSNKFGVGVSMDPYTIWASFSTPNYCQTQSRLIRFASGSEPEATDIYNSYGPFWLIMENEVPGTFATWLAPEVYRAVADDFQLGGFLGVPPYARLNEMP